MSKLLIVDDDIRLRKLVRTYGEVEHYECDEAADGLAALEKLQNENPYIQKDHLISNLNSAFHIGQKYAIIAF